MLKILKWWKRKQSSTAVGYILEKQEYMGHTVLGKTICENYKTKNGARQNRRN